MNSSDLHDDVWVWRARLGAVCVALAAVAFRQKPGLVVADTKLDLTEDPWGFMGAALHLWDPNGAFGQLQNQAYGYLFPMGPFHGVLHSVGVAPWVSQRLWWSLLLCVAFVGMWRLTNELQVGSPWLRVFGGVAFALSPRIASELTVTSIEVWPMAVAPWVLVPLVIRKNRSWGWRISRSALAFATCGGVNAVASGAVLVLPTLWFLTRRPSRRIFGAFVIWLGAVLAAMSWWLVPLLLMGRYSPPFLDWIEGAAVTTSTASVFEALRGTSAWLSFLTSSTGPEWPGGWAYATQPGVVVGTTLIAGLGLAGITLERIRERTFLALGVLVGMTLLGLGHLGGLGSPLAGPIQDLLDGPLAALRNTHKFDVVVRIPLTVGVVAFLSAGTAQLRKLGTGPWLGSSVVVSILAMSTAPSVVAGLARNEAYTAIPAHWKQASQWLDSQSEPGTVLVLPAASFADFTWGSTKDDPLQVLMKRPLAVRDAVPLGSAGATRWLDGLQRELGAGRGGPAIAETLATAGVRFVVIRNDLRLDAQGDPSVAIHAGLEESGIDLVSSFGPLTGNPGESSAVTVDYRTVLQRPSVEVYRVPGTAEAWMGPLDETPVVAAGPEDLSALTRQMQSRLVLLGTDGASVGVQAHGEEIVTDGLRRREVNFGEPTHNTSAVLSPSENVRQRRASTEFDADPLAPRTTSVWDGIAGVQASSSASDANATLRLGPANGPAAALDGDPETRWVSGTFGKATGEWLQVDFTQSRAVSGVRIAVSTAAPVSAKPAQLLVSTETGARRVMVEADALPVFVGLPSGETRWVRIALERVGQGPENGFSLSEVKLTGVEPRHLLRLPPSDQPTAIILHTDNGERSGCLDVNGHDYCSPRLSMEGEGPLDLARQIPLTHSGRYTVSGTVRSRSSPTTDRLFDLGARLKATATSRLVDSPMDRPGAALDRDLGTAWVAGLNDFNPKFTVKLPEPRNVSALQFLRAPLLAASGAKDISVTFDDGDTLRRIVDDAGYARFQARRTSSFTVEFAATRPLVDIDSRTGTRTFVPVGFSELRVLGAEDLRLPVALKATTGVPCGFGPTLSVNGVEYRTQVDGTLSDVRQGAPLKWAVCGGQGAIELPRTVNEVSGTPSSEFRLDTITLRSATAQPPKGNIIALAVARPTATRVELRLAERATETLVVVPQNFNPGWVGTAGQQVLRPLRVNGWMQGWVVPAGPAMTLQAVFQPDVPYRAALGLGGLLLVLLSVVALRCRHCGRREPAASPFTMPRGLSWGVLTLGGFLVGGATGLVLAVAISLSVLLAPRVARLTCVAAACVMPVAASMFVLTDAWPDGRANIDSVVVQALSLMSVLLAVGVGLTRSPLSHLPQR